MRKLIVSTSAYIFYFMMTLFAFNIDVLRSVCQGNQQSSESEFNCKLSQTKSNPLIAILIQSLREKNKRNSVVIVTYIHVTIPIQRRSFFACFHSNKIKYESEHEFRLNNNVDYTFPSTFSHEAISLSLFKEICISLHHYLTQN